MTRDPARTTPIGLSRYAREFYDTAMAADEVVGERPGHEIIAPVPIMYLVAHAIELSLKAYLSFSGVTLNDLASKNFGHDLDACLSEALNRNLGQIFSPDQSELDALKVLNELYYTRQLNYFERGAKDFPVFGHIQSFAARLLDAVGPHVGYK